MLQISVIFIDNIIHTLILTFETLLDFLDSLYRNAFSNFVSH